MVFGTRVARRIREVGATCWQDLAGNAGTNAFEEARRISGKTGVVVALGKVEGKVRFVSHDDTTGADRSV